MRTIWGTVTEVADLGVVAEQCPGCARLTPCLLRSVCRAKHLLFVKLTDTVRDTSCLCTVCLKSFPAEHSWRYAAVLSIAEAKMLSLDDLLARTNPVLGERLQFKDQVLAMGGDDRFAVAYE